MKNTIQDLSNYLFECIERINNDGITDEEREMEIKKFKAINDIAKSILDAGALTLKAMEYSEEYGKENAVKGDLLGIEK